MKKLIAFTLALAPVSAFAANINNVTDIFNIFTGYGNSFVAILISFAVIYIIFSVVRYLIAGGEDDRAKGRSNVLYGVLGLFIILSVWGLVAILKNSFGTNNNVPANDFPQVLNPNGAPGQR